MNFKLKSNPIAIPNPIPNPSPSPHPNPHSNPNPDPNSLVFHSMAGRMLFAHTFTAHL